MGQLCVKCLVARQALAVVVAVIAFLFVQAL